MSDLLDAFLNCQPLTKKRRIQTNFNIKVEASNARELRSDRDRDKSLKYADELKDKEENEILTEILNRQPDVTLGIDEEHEKSAIPPKDVFEKYEFELPTNDLPILTKREEILSDIAHNDVVIIRAATGSGKSSQVPQYILEEAYRTKKNVNIIVTQPRRISAQSLASRVSLERKCEVGSLVGYQIGLDRQMNNNDTRLLYCTTGVFLQKLINERSLSKWSHCIIDEIHERDIDMDFVLLILRRLLAVKKTGTKVILMSATMATESISKYFRTYFTPAILDLDVKKPFSVKVDYLDAFIEDYDCFGVSKEHIDIQNPGILPIMYSAGANIINLLVQKDVKSFLVFLPGWYEIENFERELLKMKIDFKVIKLHSTMGMDDIKDLFTSKYPRKIILSTNIAESSITIPDIDFVIDYCLVKHLEADTSTNLTQLKMVWAAKANLVQREGRVGRTKRGQVVRMIFQEHYEKIPDEAPAEMQRTSLETVVLKAKQLKMGKPIDILGLALNPPTRYSIVDAILVLKELGALTRYCQHGFDFEDGDVTFAGRLMSKLPIDVRLSKLILFGFMFNVLKETIIISAGLSVRSIFKHSSIKDMDTFESKFKFGSGSSDLLAILNVYKEWEKILNANGRCTEKQFAHDYQLDLRNLKEMRVQVDDLYKRLRELGFTKESLEENRVEKYSERMFLIKICVAGAFYPNFYVFGGNIPGRDDFGTLNNKNPCHSIFFKGFPNQHCGDFYKDQIITQLFNNKIINSRDDAEIHFDSNSSRVVVEFQNLRNDEEVKVPGDVKLEIYRALRYARVNGKYEFKLNLINLRHETSYLEQKGYNISAEDKHKRQSKEHDHTIYPKAKMHIKEEITCIISPGKFFIQPSRGKDILTEWKREILCESALRGIFDLDECVGSNLVIVKDTKGQFYRAQIIEHPYQRKPFKVRLIDYGNNVYCKFEDFYTFKGDSNPASSRAQLMTIFNHPPLCFEAKLCQCKPAVIYQTGWSHNAIQTFKQIVNNERDIDIGVYAFNVYDKVASVYLNLRETSLRSKTTISNILVSEGYSQTADESYIYKISRVTDEIKLNAKNSHFDFKDFSDAPRGREVVTLTGPLTTFLHNTFERTTLCHESDVSIDPWSVNSNLIDPYPFDGVRKVMVAASRSKNDAGKVILRHTTVLPHITGVACLLALIFSPSCELRVDRHVNRYTSILSGMGCSFDGKAYYKEHDCLFHTDVDIDSDDIANINELRDVMSELMEKVNNADERCIEDLRNRAQKKLLEILQCKRSQKGVTMNGSYNWSGENAIKKNFDENMRMFPSLNPPPLQPYSEERWKTLKLLNEEFEYKARTNSRDEEIKCVLCEEQITTLHEIQTHILRSKHNQQVLNLENAKPQNISIKREQRYTVDDCEPGPSGYQKMRK